MNMKDVLSISLVLTLTISLTYTAVASETSGQINTLFASTKICHDNSCSSFGTINFYPSGSQSKISITDSGISGYAWGNELGWINFSPSGSGVSINSDTGAISGKAWSQTSGWINFRPDNSGVIADSIPIGVSITNSGEFYGWAWNGGPYGGWIRFDCNYVASCVKTDWRPTSGRTQSIFFISLPPISNIIPTTLDKIAPQNTPEKYIEEIFVNTKRNNTIPVSDTTTNAPVNKYVESIQNNISKESIPLKPKEPSKNIDNVSKKAIDAVKVKYKSIKKNITEIANIIPKTKAKINSFISKIKIYFKF